MVSWPGCKQAEEMSRGIFGGKHPVKVGKLVGWGNVCGKTIQVGPCTGNDQEESVWEEMLRGQKCPGKISESPHRITSLHVYQL